MIGEAVHYVAQGYLYFLYGCALLGCITVAYGLLKLLRWNLVRSRWFKRDE